MAAVGFFSMKVFSETTDSLLGKAVICTCVAFLPLLSCVKLCLGHGILYYGEIVSGISLKTPLPVPDLMWISLFCLSTCILGRWSALLGRA